MKLHEVDGAKNYARHHLRHWYVPTSSNKSVSALLKQCSGAGVDAVGSEVEGVLSAASFVHTSFLAVSSSVVKKRMYPLPDIWAPCRSLLMISLSISFQFSGILSSQHIASTPSVRKGHPEEDVGSEPEEGLDSTYFLKLLCLRLQEDPLQDGGNRYSQMQLSSIYVAHRSLWSGGDFRGFGVLWIGLDAGLCMCVSQSL